MCRPPRARDLVSATMPLMNALADATGYSLHLVVVHQGETAVVVTHGASLRVAIAGMLGWPVETAGGMVAMDNCAWATLAETGAGRLRLSSYNRTVATSPPD